MKTLKKNGVGLLHLLGELLMFFGGLWLCSSVIAAFVIPFGSYVNEGILGRLLICLVYLIFAAVSLLIIRGGNFLRKYGKPKEKNGSSDSAPKAGSGETVHRYAFGKLSASEPKYQTIGQAAEILARSGFALWSIYTEDGLSSHSGTMGFQKTYGSFQEFLEKARADYLSFAEGKQVGSPEWEWFQTCFLFENSNSVRIVISIPEENGKNAPREAVYQVLLRGVPTPEQKECIARVQEDLRPLAGSVDRLQSQLHEYQTRGPEERKERQTEAGATAKELGERLLEAPKLWVLCCDFPGPMKPVYMGTDGRMEIFTDPHLVHGGQKALLERLNLKTAVRTLNGPEEIRGFFRECAHNGFQVFRLDNGGKDSCELWLKDFFPYREKELIDEKNCSLRYMFHRAKLYSWLRSCQKDPNSNDSMAIAEMMLTMQLNGYRELGNALIYALGNAMPEDRVYGTAAAREKLGQWLPDSGCEACVDLDGPAYQEKLQLGFVNRPGEQGDIEKGSVCIFTDLAQAKAARELFLQSNMDFSVIVITFEELMAQAVQCAGIVVDMQALSFEIPKAEYGKLRELQQLGGAPLVVNLKRKPQCRHTEMKGGWKQFDYQWPHRYGFDQMLQWAQWLIDHEMKAMTLVTAGIAGAAETERIEELRSHKEKVSETVTVEAGVLGLGGGFSGFMAKVYWYNQTNVVRIFTAGDIEQEKVDALVERLYQAWNG